MARIDKPKLVKSASLGDIVWFVPTESHKSIIHDDYVKYSESELDIILESKIKGDELKLIHNIKKEFNGIIVKDQLKVR